MTRYGFVFPGQGSQFVGMGKSLYDTFPEARIVFEQFEVVVPGLLAVCFNGPEEVLRQTQYTQPGILATSLAALAVFQAHYPMVQPLVTAGHSLGEYGALVTSGVIDVPTAAQLVAKRAYLMAQAPAGAMAVVLGLSAEAVEAILPQENGVLVVANDNGPDQVVVAGEVLALEAAMALLKVAGAKRVMPLNVSGAFHSPLMHQAAEAFDRFLVGVPFNTAVVPVVTNVDALLTTEGHAAKLARQIEQGVRWTATMDTMVHAVGIETVLEFGPGKVLTGLFKKAHPGVSAIHIGDVESLTAFSTFSNTLCCELSP